MTDAEILKALRPVADNLLQVFFNGAEMPEDPTELFFHEGESGSYREVIRALVIVACDGQRPPSRPEDAFEDRQVVTEHWLAHRSG